MNCEFLAVCAILFIIYIVIGIILWLIVVASNCYTACLIDEHLILVVFFYPIVIPIILYLEFKKFVKELKENVKE